MGSGRRPPNKNRASVSLDALTGGVGGVGTLNCELSGSLHTNPADGEVPNSVPLELAVSNGVLVVVGAGTTWRVEMTALAENVCVCVARGKIYGLRRLNPFEVGVRPK